MSAVLNPDRLIADETVHRRLCSLLRLLATDVDGERAAAGARIADLALTHRIDWEVAIPTKQSVLGYAQRETSKLRLELEIERINRAFSGAKTHGAGLDDDPHERAAKILNAKRIVLSPKERDFLMDMADWGGRLSSRQEAWLDALWAKHERAGRP